MTSRDFCYWLQGFFELSGDDLYIGDREADLIKRHLNMVFIHEIDPSFPDEQQEPLSRAHEGSAFNIESNTTYSRSPMVEC